MVYLCQTCWELLLLCAKRDYEKHGFFLSLARQWPIIYFFKIISKWAWPKMWYFFYLFVNADFYSQLMMGFLKTKLNFRNHKQSGGVKNWWCNYHMSCTKKKKKTSQFLMELLNCTDMTKVCSLKCPFSQFPTQP